MTATVTTAPQQDQQPQFRSHRQLFKALERLRRRVNRRDRERLIATADLHAHLAAAERTTDAFAFSLWLLSARTLEGSLTVEARERQRVAVALAFGLAPLEVAADVQWMKKMLIYGHRHYLRMREATRKDSERARRNYEARAAGQQLRQQDKTD